MISVWQCWNIFRYILVNCAWQNIQTWSSPDYGQTLLQLHNVSYQGQKGIVGKAVQNIDGSKYHYQKVLPNSTEVSSVPRYNLWVAFLSQSCDQMSFILWSLFRLLFSFPFLFSSSPSSNFISSFIAFILELVKLSSQRIHHHLYMRWAHLGTLVGVSLLQVSADRKLDKPCPCLAS